jgi:predicted enzyme related to lactoylglutathione lyase
VSSRPRLEIGIDCPNPDALAPFWEFALGYRREEGESDDEMFIDLAPPDGEGPVVFLQRVPEPKATKNRLHLDLYVAEPEAFMEQLEDLGALRLGEPVMEGDEWAFQVMADPVGNEFCVCRET